MGNNHNSSRKVSKKDLFVSQMVGTSKRELAKTVLQGYQIDTNELFIRNDRKVTQLYKMEKEPIGKGAYGEVWKGKHTKTDAPRAIKKLNRKYKEKCDKIKSNEKGNAFVMWRKVFSTTREENILSVRKNWLFELMRILGLIGLFFL